VHDAGDVDAVMTDAHDHLEPERLGRSTLRRLGFTLTCGSAGSAFGPAGAAEGDAAVDVARLYHVALDGSGDAFYHAAFTGVQMG